MATAEQALREMREGHVQSIRSAIVEWAKEHAPSASVGAMFDLADTAEKCVGSIANEAFRIGMNHKVYQKDAA